MSGSTFKMTDKDVDKIIQKIKSHIHDDKNGYCRVGWAMVEELGKDKVYNDKEQTLKKVRITSLITQSGQYKADPSIKDYKDWDIKLNDGFIKSQLEIKLAESNLKANKLNFTNSRLNNKTTVINVIVGIINLILIAYQIFIKNQT